MNSLHAFLRTATADLHKETEVIMGIHRLTAVDLARSEFTDHLRQMWRAHHQIDKMISAFSELEQVAPFLAREDFQLALESDLEQLTESERSVSDRISSLLEVKEKISNWQEAVGALYVVNGASLGRMFLSKVLKARFDAWGLESPSYYGLQEDTPSFWEEYTMNLNQLTTDEADYKSFLRGAEIAYRVFMGSGAMKSIA